MNFRNMDYNAARPMNNLARQPSLYSLTFNEFQNSLGGVGKDFGSMNMDELLKNIWTAEETEGMVTPFASAERGLGIGNLQQQGSLTLPRTLSQKTVDEVWKDLFKENGGKDVNSNLGSSLQQKQQTLGEMTLEEFLVRAGVVREETQIAGRPTTSSGIYGELSPSSNNSEGLSIAYPQPGQTNGVIGDIVMGNNNNTSNIYQFSNHSNQSPPKPVIDVNNIRSQQQLFPPNQAMMVFGSSMCGDELGNSGMREPVMSNGFRQGGHGMQSVAGKALVGLGPGSIMTGTGSPTNQPSLGVAQKRNLDTSSLSPLPYVLNGGLRGRKCGGAVEKVVERRQKRMIKNRESAARSRARKQAYTIELEAELAKLKEEKEEIQKKQAEIMEKHKNQILKALNLQHRSKKRCLRRTQTGPW